jgi:hypothetical protein
VLALTPDLLGADEVDGRESLGRQPIRVLENRDIISGREPEVSDVNRIVDKATPLL